MINFIFSKDKTSQILLCHFVLLLFFDSWFGKQSVNTSPIHYISSQQNINRQKKTLKKCKKNNKIQIDKNIEKAQNKQQKIIQKMKFDL